MSQLKQARIDAGLSIEEVSRQLNIRKHYIAALEENRLNEIPSVVYTKGYMKMYAKLLGINLAPGDLDFTQEDRCKKIITSCSKAKLGVRILAGFSLIIGLWFYMMNFSHTRQKDVVDILENIEPTNYLLNFQKPKDDPQLKDAEDVTHSMPPTNGKLNDIDE